MDNKWRSISLLLVKAIIIFISYIALSRLLTFVLFSILSSDDLVTNPFVQAELTTFFQFIIIAIIVFIINKTNLWTRSQNTFSIKGINIIYILVLSLSTRIIIQGILWIDEILTNTPIDIRRHNYDFLKNLNIIIAVYSIILAPFIEEIIFRKWILGLFQNKGSQIYLGLVVSTILFYFIHPDSSIFNISFVGLMLGLIYLRYGLLGSMIFHSLMNLFWFIVRTNHMLYEKIINWLDFGFLYWLFVLASA